MHFVKKMYFQIPMWTIFNLLVICACAVSAQEWVLDWAEEFDGEEINATTWQHEVTMWGGGVRFFRMLKEMFVLM